MLLFTEGFDWSTSTVNIQNTTKWELFGSFNINTTNQRFTSGGNNINGTGRGSGNRLYRPIGQNLVSGVIGFAVRIDASASYQMNFCHLSDGIPASGTVQLGVILNDDLTLSIIRNSTANVLGTTTFALSTATWHYIEFKFKISDSISAGDVQIYVDGDSKLSLAAATDTKHTSNAYATYMGFNGNSPAVTTPGGGAYYIDDIYLIDLTGSTNNAPLGNVRIQTLLPNGNGNSSQFTGSDGNSTDNYLLVDEPNYATTDYVDGANVGDKDTYAFANTTATTATIYGLTINVNALKTDAGARGIKPVVRHSGTDYDGTEITLSTSAIGYQQVYEQNPGTSSGWTKSDVDAAEFGVKVST